LFHDASFSCNNSTAAFCDREIEGKKKEKKERNRITYRKQLGHRECGGRHQRKELDAGTQ
jgi:hypothetical protein